jgi:hypothetical protein
MSNMYFGLGTQIKKPKKKIYFLFGQKIAILDYHSYTIVHSNHKFINQ